MPLRIVTIRTNNKLIAPIVSATSLTSTGDVSIGGVITAPNQPCFRAIPSQDVIISSAGSFPALPYDSVVIDNASGYNTNPLY